MYIDVYSKNFRVKCNFRNIVLVTVVLHLILDN